MASVLPTPSDCCNTCVCNVVDVELPCSGGGDGSHLVVENLSALRLVLANQRTDNMVVDTLTYDGTPLDGTQWTSIWRPDDLTPDGPPLATRPADVLTDADPGRFRQY